MCGHVGVAGALEARDEKLLKRLLIFDYFRGPDSTGFAALKKDGGSMISKVSSHPIDLFQMKSFTDALQGYKSSVFLGHNRFATKGAVNSYNAHPYEFGDIVGAHNGTLDKSSWDALHKDLETEYPTDSMAIIAHIAKFGIEATAPLLQGAWALVWFDKVKAELYFLRNAERPFWLGYNNDLKKVFWASENAHIRAAIDTAETAQPYTLWRTKEKGYCFFSTDIDVLYTVPLAELIGGKMDKDVQPDFRGKTLKGKEVVKSTGITYHTPGKTTTPFTGNGVTPGNTGSNLVTTIGNPLGTFQKTSGETSKTPTTTSPGTSIDNVIHLRGTEFNPLAGYIIESDFTKYAKHGCSWCQADVNFGDIGITVYPEHDAVRCAECSQIGNHNRIFIDPREFVKVGAK